MSRLLAALDDSAATAPVLAVARWLGSLLGLEVVALHVSEDGSGATARTTAESAGVKCDVREGDAVCAIRDAADDPDVAAIVIGARGLPMNRMPAGHVVLDVIRRVAKPVIVVPPDVRVPVGDRLRVLAPVDDEPATAAALRQLLDEMRPPDLELVLLHVFDARHMPMFANHGGYDTEIWCRELARRTTPLQTEARVETRVGHPAHTILAVERELEADLIVVGWAGDLSHGRASVVKRLLAHTKTPLVFVPAVPAPNQEPRSSAREVMSYERAG